MNKNFVLVVYDISDDKRRTRLHDVLLNYGTPVQYSVFECLLDSRELGKMKKAVRKVIRPRKDNLRIYYLCATCREKTETTGGAEVKQDTPEALVV
jgi:CRISPR-associated protein Cas2